MKVVNGPNEWRLVRTDRDGASVGDVLDTLGPVMAFFLGPIQPTTVLNKGPEAAIETSKGSADNPQSWEWRIGAARPIVALSVGHDPKPLSAGTKLGSRTDPDVLPVVKGEKPWFVNVLFFWRAPTAELAYPALEVGLLGGRSREPSANLDWYLDDARQPAVAPIDPGDQTWLEAQEENVEEALEEFGGTALKVAVGGGVLLALLWLLSKR